MLTLYRYNDVHNSINVGFVAKLVKGPHLRIRLIAFAILQKRLITSNSIIRLIRYIVVPNSITINRGFVCCKNSYICNISMNDLSR